MNEHELSSSEGEKLIDERKREKRSVSNSEINSSLLSESQLATKKRKENNKSNEERTLELCNINYKNVENVENTCICGSENSNVESNVIPKNTQEVCLECSNAKCSTNIILVEKKSDEPPERNEEFVPNVERLPSMYQEHLLHSLRQKQFVNIEANCRCKSNTTQITRDEILEKENENIQEKEQPNITENKNISAETVDLLYTKPKNLQEMESVEDVNHKNNNYIYSSDDDANSPNDNSSTKKKEVAPKFSDDSNESAATEISANTNVSSTNADINAYSGTIISSYTSTSESIIETKKEDRYGNDETQSMQLKRVETNVESIANENDVSRDTNSKTREFAEKSNIVEPLSFPARQVNNRETIKSYDDVSGSFGFKIYSNENYENLESLSASSTSGYITETSDVWSFSSKFFSKLQRSSLQQTSMLFTNNNSRLVSTNSSIRDRVNEKNVEDACCYAGCTHCNCGKAEPLHQFNMQANTAKFITSKENIPLHKLNSNSFEGTNGSTFAYEHYLISRNKQNSNKINCNCNWYYNNSSKNYNTQKNLICHTESNELIYEQLQHKQHQHPSFHPHPCFAHSHYRQEHSSSQETNTATISTTPKASLENLSLYERSSSSSRELIQRESTLLNECYKTSSDEEMHKTVRLPVFLPPASIKLIKKRKVNNVTADSSASIENVNKTLPGNTKTNSNIFLHNREVSCDKSTCVAELSKTSPPETFVNKLNVKNDNTILIDQAIEQKDKNVQTLECTKTEPNKEFNLGDVKTHEIYYGNKHDIFEPISLAKRKQENENRILQMCRSMEKTEQDDNVLEEQEEIIKEKSKSKSNELNDRLVSKMEIEDDHLELPKSSRNNNNNNNNNNNSSNNSNNNNILWCNDTFSLEEQAQNSNTTIDSRNMFLSSVTSISSPEVVRQTSVTRKWKKKSTRERYLNNYRIIKVLGQGECGKVKLAYDEVQKRYVAIKQVYRADTSKRRVGGPTQAQQLYLAFLREVKIMKNLRHSNIASVYEIIDDPNADKVYLVMQYIENGPIAHIEVRSDSDEVCEPIPPVELARAARQIFAGLEYLHRHGIVHRDLKPDNILMSRDKHVYLVDFGVAEAIDTTYRARIERKMAHSMAQSIAMSEAGEHACGPLVVGAKGTLLFIAPEVWTEKKIYGKAVDMWAVGVTLYILLTGKLPFHNLSEVNDPLLPVIPTCYGNGWSQLLCGLLERNAEKRLTVTQARVIIKAILFCQLQNQSLKKMISFPSVYKQNSLQLMDTLDHVNLYSTESLSPTEQNKILSHNNSNVCVKSYDNTVLLKNQSDVQSLLDQNSKSSCLSQTSTSNSNASENVSSNHEPNAVKKCNYNIFSRYIHSPVHRTLSNMYSENNQKTGIYPFGVCTVRLPPALNEPTERVFIPHAPYIKTVPVFAPFIHNVQHTSQELEEEEKEEKMNIMEELPIEHVSKIISNTATRSESLLTSTLVTSASTTTTTTEEQIASFNFNAFTSYEKNEEKDISHVHSNQVSSAFSSLETLQNLENTLPQTFEPNTEQDSKEWNFPPSILESIQFTLSTASNQSPASPPLSLSSESLSLAVRVSPLPTVTSSELVINTESSAGPVTSIVARNEEVTRVPKELNLSPESEPPKLMSLTSHNSTSVTHNDTVAQEVNSPILVVQKAVGINSPREVEEHISRQISETILVSSGSWAPKSANDNNNSDDIALSTSFKKRWLENGRGRGLLQRQQRYWNRLLRSKVTLQAPESVPECTSDDLSSSSPPPPLTIIAAAPLSNTNSCATSHFDSTTINIDCNSDLLAQSPIDKNNKSRESEQDVLHGNANAMNSSCQNQSSKIGKELVSQESLPLQNVELNHSTDHGKLNDVNTKCEPYSEVVKETGIIASNAETDNSTANSITRKEKQKISETENALSETTYELTKYKPRFNMYKSDGTVRRVNRYSVYSNSSYVPSTRSFDDESPDSNLKGSIFAGFAVPQSTKEILPKVCKVVSPTRKSDGSHVDEPYEPVFHVSSTALPSAYDHNDVNKTNKTNIINKDDRKGNDDNNNDDYVNLFNPVQHHESRNWLTKTDITNLQLQECEELKTHQNENARFTNKQNWWGNEGNVKLEGRYLCEHELSSREQVLNDCNVDDFSNNNIINSNATKHNDFRELQLSRFVNVNVKSSSWNTQLVNLEADKNTCESSISDSSNNKNSRNSVNSVNINNNSNRVTRSSGKRETVEKSNISVNNNKTSLSPSEREFWKVTNFDSGESEVDNRLPHQKPEENTLKDCSKWTVLSSQSKKDSSAVRISAIPFMKRESLKDYNQLTCSSSISTTPFITDTSTTLTTEMQSEEFSRLDPRRRLYRRTTLRSTATSENDVEDNNSTTLNLNKATSKIM